MISSSENRFFGFQNENEEDEKQKEFGNQRLEEDLDEDRKPLSGFIFEKEQAEKQLAPAEKFEDEEEEEEEKYFPKPFSSESFPDRMASEEKRKQELIESVSKISSIEEGENEFQKEETEEPVPQVLNLDIGEKEEEINEEENVKTESSLPEVKEEVTAEKEEKIDEIEAQPVAEEEPKETSDVDLENQIPIKILSQEKEEPKLIDEGDKNEVDEIIPIKINNTSNENPAPAVKEELPLEDKLEKEIADQSKNNPELMKVFKDEEGENVLKIEVKEEETAEKEELKKEMEKEPLLNPTENQNVSLKVTDGDLEQVESEKEESPVSEIKEETKEPESPVLEQAESVEETAVESEKEKEEETQTEPIAEVEMQKPAFEMDDKDFKEKIGESFEKYKNEMTQEGKEKIIAEIGFLILEDQEKFKDQFDVYGLVENLGKSLFHRMIISQEKAKIEKENGKIINLSPFSKINFSEEASPEETKYKEELLLNLSSIDNAEDSDKEIFKRFLVDLVEYLRFQKFEEEKNLLETEENPEKEESGEEEQKKEEENPSIVK